MILPKSVPATSQPYTLPMEWAGSVSSDKLLPFLRKKGYILHPVLNSAPWQKATGKIIKNDA